MIEDELLIFRMQQAREAKRDYELDTTPENREVYQQARGNFRQAVINQMRNQMDVGLLTYLEAAEGVKAAFETIRAVEHWLQRHGQDTGIPANFVSQINLPSPHTVSVNNLCGTESKFKGAFADYLTPEAEAIFEDRYMYHDDHDTEERETPPIMSNHAKGFNAGLGR